LNSSYNSPPISYGSSGGRVTAKSKPWQCASQKWSQPRNLTELTLSLHGSMHMGIMYSPPFPGADHSAYPFPGDHKELYSKYKNLFLLLKGKRWLLRPHALRLVSGAEATTLQPPIANIFQTHVGVVVTLGYGEPGSTVKVELSTEVATTSSAIVHHAGGKMRHIEAHGVAASAEAMLYSVELGSDGEAILQLRA
jgi:hypothetical protein